MEIEELEEAMKWLYVALFAIIFTGCNINEEEYIKGYKEAYVKGCTSTFNGPKPMLNELVKACECQVNKIIDHFNITQLGDEDVLMKYALEETGECMKGLNFYKFKRQSNQNNVN